MQKINILLNFTKFARHAFNSLVGALEAHIDQNAVTIKGARTFTKLQQALEQSDPNEITLVLWTFYSPSFDQARQQLKQLQEKDKPDHIIHLAGGVHATAEPLQTLRAGFDYVAIGEGEQIIVDFVNQLITNKALDNIQGIAYLNDGKLVRNGRGQLVDLNLYPPFAPLNQKFGAIEITRGCIYACKFCQTPYVSKARFRHRNVDNIAHYAEIMRNKGFRDYRFITPTSLSYGSNDEKVNLQAVEDLLSSVRKVVGSEARIFFGSFPSEVRPEHVSIEALRLLKRFVDNDNLIIGGQSGSQQVLDITKRGHSVEDIIRAVEITTKEGFTANVDFLFGLPGETEADAKLSRDLIKTLTAMGAKIHTHTFMPLPGTPLKQSDAGDIHIETQQLLGELESRGQAYGQWKTQIQKARELEKIRNEK